MHMKSMLRRERAVRDDAYCRTRRAKITFACLPVRVISRVELPVFRHRYVDLQGKR